MKKSIKVALLSGLVFPGLSVIVVVATRRALSVVDSMTSGEIPVDAGAITELASSSMSGADNSLVNYSLVVLGVCWIVGIIDSYRLGSSQEK
jgi:hypothetical protein